jgi:hypothetical protein
MEQTVLRDLKEFKGFRVFKAIQDRKAFRGFKESRVCKVTPDHKGFREILGLKEFKESRESKDLREIQALTEPTVSTEHRDLRESKENQLPLMIATRRWEHFVSLTGLLLRMLYLPSLPFRPLIPGYKSTKTVMWLRKSLSREIPIVPL